VQRYPRGAPGWLVESIAEAARFSLSPAGDVWVRRQQRADRAKADYHGGYNLTGPFLLWVESKYAPGFCAKLDAACRASTYTDAIFQEHAGKALDTLWEEFKTAPIDGLIKPQPAAR
jgi:hypothetical protein